MFNDISCSDYDRAERFALLKGLRKSNIIRLIQTEKSIMYSYLPPLRRAMSIKNVSLISLPAIPLIYPTIKLSLSYHHRNHS